MTPQCPASYGAWWIATLLVVLESHHARPVSLRRNLAHPLAHARNRSADTIGFPRSEALRALPD